MEQEKRSKVNPTQSMRDAMKKATTEMLVLFMLRQKPNVCMGVMPIRVVDGEVGAHTLVYTFRLDEAAQKQQPIIPPKFNGQGNDQLASKAAVLGFLGRLHRCPQGLSVFPRCRGLGRQ